MVELCPPLRKDTRPLGGLAPDMVTYLYAPPDRSHPTGVQSSQTFQGHWRALPLCSRLTAVRRGWSGMAQSQRSKVLLAKSLAQTSLLSGPCWGNVAGRLIRGDVPPNLGKSWNGRRRRRVPELSNVCHFADTQRILTQRAELCDPLLIRWSANPRA